MPWVYLFLASVFEIFWALCLKYTDGVTRVAPTLLTLVFAGASIGLLGLATKTLPIGTSYAIWTGIGTAGTAVLGIYLFGEPATTLRLACIALIFAGMIGLKLVD
jgi:quaternary ammonium compound-resistance protein SugE